MFGYFLNTFMVLLHILFLKAPVVDLLGYRSTMVGFGIQIHGILSIEMSVGSKNSKRMSWKKFQELVACEKQNGGGVQLL